MLPLILITFVFLTGFGLILGSLDRADIMNNWDSRRCDVPVLVTSSLYKTNEYPNSAIEFAIDNFTFCMNHIAQEVFTAALSPFIAIMSQQLNAASVLQDIQNSLRMMLANFQKGFSDLLDGVFQRFMMVGFSFRQTYSKFQSAMERAFAIALNTVFIGISMVVGLDNSYKFLTNVVIIILGVLVGIFILLFIVLIPVVPLIFTAIATLTAAGLGGALGGMGDTFCFSPSTLIEKKEGDRFIKVRIDSLKTGDVLRTGVVEGVLRTEGHTTQLYKVGDIKVSGSHLIHYKYKNKWVSVNEYPGAIPIHEKEAVLICLNVTSRIIEINGLQFRDWEELPEKDIKAQMAWNLLVANKINAVTCNPTIHSYPLVSGDWLVDSKFKGPKRIRTVQIGEFIADGNQWTKVLGVYEGEEEAVNKSYWTSDSTWFRESEWMQRPNKKVVKTLKPGYQLITRSGSFSIISLDQTTHRIRDFTEVGIDQIESTYSWMKSILSNPNSE